MSFYIFVKYYNAFVVHVRKRRPPTLQSPSVKLIISGSRSKFANHSNFTEYDLLVRSVPHISSQLVLFIS
jgi:hypothetical protein